MPRPLAIEILDAIVSSYRSQRMHAHEHENDAPTEERDFEVGEFTSLELSGPFDVEIRTGESASVHATGPDWALDSLAVEHKGKRLFIGCDGDCSSDVEIVVGVQDLHALRMTGSGDVSIDSVKGERFECASSGSGDLEVDEIDVRTLDLAAV